MAVTTQDQLELVMDILKMRTVMMTIAFDGRNTKLYECVTRGDDISAEAHVRGLFVRSSDALYMARITLEKVRSDEEKELVEEQVSVLQTENFMLEQLIELIEKIRGRMSSDYLNRSNTDLMKMVNSAVGVPGEHLYVTP